ncbi:ATP-grasp domain-containing protein [Micromonospora sp. NPDC005172]|uniref:ATP-grasp domain-containing protein n=1 Tax=Micromonospora sp. NPDC005172 TaxID=3156867 RepID=UPI0033A09F49
MAKYAKDRQERFILIMANPTWEQGLVDRALDVNTANLDEVVAAVRELASSERDHIRAVLTFSEHSVTAAAAAAAELGLLFVSQQSARLARDKYAMRRAFENEGLVQPLYGLARNIAEARQQAERIGFPLVLKPLIGGGSQHVRRIDSISELDTHFESCRIESWADLSYDPLCGRTMTNYEAALLLEGFIPGREVSVESIVDGDNTNVVAVHDKPLPQAGPFFEEYFYSTPSQLSQVVIDGVKASTASAHRALGITIGATHTEFRILPDGTPVILEAAARLGGGPLFESVLLSTGVDMIAAALDLAMGDKPELTMRRLPTPAGFCQFFAKKPGQVKGIQGVTEALEIPGVRDVAIYCESGDDVGVPPYVMQGYGHAVFSATTFEELTAVFNSLQQLIQVEVD